MVLTSACSTDGGPPVGDSAAPSWTSSTDSEAGTGHLDVGDLVGTPLESQFSGKAVRVTGRVAARADGCVTVIVDGVERVPLWPVGTTVAQSGDDDTRYVVKLPGGATLTAHGSTGDGFEATAIVSDVPATAAAGSTEPTGKAESFLAFCAISAPPVAFPNAGTFRARQR